MKHLPCGNQSQLQHSRAGWLSRCWLLLGLVTSAWLLVEAAPASIFGTNSGRPSLSLQSPVKDNWVLRTKNIEDVEVGDLALSRDEATGKIAPKRVTAVFRRVSHHLRVLRIHSADGSEFQQLTTTDEHPFWVVGKGWVQASELREGDRLIQSDGEPATFAGLWFESHLEGVTVFNIETEEYHTYFAGGSVSTARPVCVHNCKGGGRVLVDSSSVVGLRRDPTLGGRIRPGEQAEVSYVTRPELRNAVSTGSLRGVPKVLDDLPVDTTPPSVDIRITIRGDLPSGRGRFGDGIIGGQAVEEGIPLVTDDKNLGDAVRRAGGVVR